MKILILLDALGTGGTERQMESMLQNWPREDQVEVCALAEGGEAESRFRTLAPVHVIPRDGRLDLRQAAPLRRLVRERGIDVVLAAHRYAGLVAKLARLTGLRAPVVCSIRGRHAYSSVQRVVYDHVDLWLMKLASAVITNSQRVADDLRARPSFRARLEIVPNGLDPTRLEPGDGRVVRAALGIGESAVVMLCVGRMVEVKDPLRAIDVLEHLGVAEIDAHLVWVGDGPLTSAMTAEAEQRGFPERVHLVGSVEDPRDHYAAATFLLHPSKWENLSNTILEGMAAGLAIVTRDVGGNSELVHDGIHGLLDDDLEGAALRLAREPDTRARMGGEGARRVRAEFTLATAIARHRAILARACEECQ